MTLDPNVALAVVRSDQLDPPRGTSTKPTSFEGTSLAKVASMPLDALTLDVELQPRETIDLELVAEYAEAIAAGAVFPPVTVFQNGKAELLLADGWHRFYGHERAGRDQIEVEVIEGDRLAALRFSLAANAKHGRRRDDGTLQRAYEPRGEAQAGRRDRHRWCASGARRWPEHG